MSIIQIVNRIRLEQPQEPNERVKDWLDLTWCMAIAEYEAEEYMERGEEQGDRINRKGFGAESNRYQP